MLAVYLHMLNITVFPFSRRRKSLDPHRDTQPMSPPPYSSIYTHRSFDNHSIVIMYYIIARACATRRAEFTSGRNYRRHLAYIKLAYWSYYKHSFVTAMAASVFSWRGCCSPAYAYENFFLNFFPSDTRLKTGRLCYLTIFTSLAGESTQKNAVTNIMSSYIQRLHRLH